MSRATIGTEHDKHKCSQNEHGPERRQLQDVADDCAVFSGPGIVVIAVEQHLVADVANPVLRGLHQPKTQIFRRKLDSVKVSRNVAVGRKHNDGGGVRVLLGLRIELKLEADRFGERFDLVSLAGEEVPALIGVRAAIALHDVPLFFGGHFRGFPRVEAHGEDVKILAEIEGQCLHRTNQPLQQFAAEHGALVVTQVQDHRASVPEIVGKFDRVAEFVFEFEIAGNFSVEMLFDADKFESDGTLVDRRTHDAAARHRTARALRKQRSG